MSPSSLHSVFPLATVFTHQCFPPSKSHPQPPQNNLRSNCYQASVANTVLCCPLPSSLLEKMGSPIHQELSLPTLLCLIITASLGQPYPLGAIRPTGSVVFILCSQALGTVGIPHPRMPHLGNLPTAMENKDRCIVTDSARAVRPRIVVSIQNIFLSFPNAHGIGTTNTHTSLSNASDPESMRGTQGNDANTVPFYRRAKRPWIWVSVGSWSQQPLNGHDCGGCSAYTPHTHTHHRLWLVAEFIE